MDAKDREHVKQVFNTVTVDGTNAEEEARKREADPHYKLPIKPWILRMAGRFSVLRGSGQNLMADLLFEHDIMRICQPPGNKRRWDFEPDQV